LHKDSGEKTIDRSSKRLALTPENDFYQKAGLYMAPPMIESYEKNPQESIKYDYGSFVSVVDVVGIVRKGTLIKCCRIEKQSGYSWWYGSISGVSYRASISNGPYSGKEVNIEDLSATTKSKEDDDLLLRKPDSRLLMLTQQ